MNQTPPANSASPNGAELRPGQLDGAAAPAPPKTATPAEAEPRAAAAPTPAAEQKHFSLHLAENVAAALSYLFGWISGLIFLLVDRRPYVRYHAAQSVMVFGTLSVLLLVFGDFFLGTFLPQAGGILLVLRRVVEIVWLVGAVVLMLKASSGERYRVPYAAPEAERAAKAKG
jgi:uncharacterized membrane protein